MPSRAFAPKIPARWNKLAPNSLRHALELCKDYAREVRNLSVERIADEMGVTDHWSLYKWMQNGRMPVNLVRPFESACGINYVSRWIATSGGKLLVELAGGRLGHAFFASDGASATEIALKMSFHSWRNRGFDKKRDFLCLEGSYHGETVGALAVTDVAIFRDAYAPLVRPAATVPTPDARQAKDGETAVDVARRAAKAPCGRQGL